MEVKQSIIIPAYNEARRIGSTLDSVVAFLELQNALPRDYEIIVVCDGCKDNTADVVSSYRSRLPLRLISYSDNRGKGYAVRQGMAASSGRIVGFMDADGATPITEFGRLSELILTGAADIVVGSRRARGAAVGLKQSFLRQALGRAFAWHVQAVLGLGISDTQCGFKVFEGSLGRDLFRQLSCDGFAFDLEVLTAAQRRGCRVIEQGVEWHEVAGSTVHPFRDGIRMLRAIRQIRSRMLPKQRAVVARGVLVPQAIDCRKEEPL